MLNKHSWRWFFYNVNCEAKRFYGVEIKFIYCGVIITDVYGNNRAEFCGDDFPKLFEDVVAYMRHTFKRRVAVIKIKKGVKKW